MVLDFTKTSLFTYDQAPFFKEPNLGAPIVREWCKFHFLGFHFYFLRKMSLTTVTHFRPLDPPLGGASMRQTCVLLKEFDVFSQNPYFYYEDLILSGLVAHCPGHGPPMSHLGASYGSLFSLG